MPQIIAVSTSARCEMVDVTARVARVLEEHPDWQDGFLVVTSQHTTCAVTINENCDPDVRSDMTQFLSRLIPENAGFRHAEGNSDAHIKTSLVGLSVMIPVTKGRIAFGTWQGVYLCEFDGPRQRKLRIAFMPAM